MANTPNNLNELFGLPLPTTGDGHSSAVVNNYKNLDDSVTAVDGVYDSNANKIWNDATSAELQMKLGDTIGNYAITTDDKGNKYQTTVDAEGNSKLVPYAGKTRRFYEYGTKDPTSDAVKFGLSTGKYSSSDARYSDLLGHPSGELGVDVRRKILDVELPYDKATELEAVLHGNKTAQQARLVQLGDAKKRKLYGGGASEYYSNVEGVLGDVSGVDLSGVSVPRFVNDEDTKKATRPKVSGNVYDIVNLLSPEGTPITSEYRLPEEATNKFGTVAKGDVGNAIVGGLGTVVKEGVLKPLDFIGDVTGTFSLGDVDKRFNKFIGYDTTNTRKVQAKVSGLTDIVLDDKAKWQDRLAAGMQATYETVKDPDQLTTSLGTLAAWMLPGTWLKLLGVGEKAVLTSKAIDKAMDAGTMTRTAGTVEKMKLLGTESGLKKLGAEQSGMISAAFGNVNEQYNEFVKNNNGKELVGADKLEWFATRLPVQLVNQNLDALTDISILKSPGLIRSATQAVDDLGNKQFAKLALGVGEVIGSTVFKEMPKEATQEYTQQMMELFNKKYGSEKFKDLDSFEKFVTDKENLKESVQAALSGAGGAVQFKALDTGFKAPKVVANAVQSGVNRIQQAQAQGEAEQAPVPSSPTTLSEKYGSPEVAKSTVDSTMAEFNKAIEDNKIGTANKLLTKLYEDIKIDTEGHIDRGVFTAARDLVVQKNDSIAARIADNNGEIDAETMQLLGSDKDSIGMLFQKTSTPELEHMVSKLPADADKGIVSRLKALVVERKTLDQVSSQIGADMRKYWDNIKYGAIDSDREVMLGNMVRLASNEIDKVSKMQADIEEVEARIRSDIETRPSATVNDFQGSKTVQYPAGGSYVINYRNIAEKVLSENTNNVVRNGVYKTLDKVKDEATAAKRITSMAMKVIDKKKAKDEQSTTSTLDTITNPVDSISEVNVPEPSTDAQSEEIKAVISDINIPNDGVNTVIDAINVDEVQTQSAENIAEMDKMAEEAKSLAEPKKVHESLRGVIIMGNSGIGKSYAKKMYADIVDGDDLFVQAANTILAKYKQQEHTIDSVSQMRSVFTLWGQYGKDEGKKTEAIKRRDEVYAEYARLAKTAATAGKTVLSSSARPDILKNAKVAVIQTDPETIAKNRASSLRDNQEEFNLEEASNKIKSFQEKVKDLQQIELSTGMYISDVLENGLSTFIKSKGPQVKKESRARKIKSAAEIRIGEGEDEAAARVKAMFKTEDEVKAYAETLSDDDLAEQTMSMKENQKTQEQLDKEEFQKFSDSVDEIANRPEGTEDGVVDIPVDGSVAVTSATDEGKPSRGKEVLDGAPLFNQNIDGVKVQSNLAAETFQDSGRGIDTSLLSEITAAVFNGKVQSVHREIHKVLQQLVKYDEFSHVKTQSNPFLMFVHKDKNYGQLFVDRKIAEAFTVGLTAYIADKFGTLRNNDNTQIQKLLGTTALIPASVRAKLSKQGRLLDNEADAIGRMIVSAMGVKSKDDVDYDMQERLASSVGTVALMVFQELGMVEIDNSMDASQLSHMRSIAEKLDVDGVPATIANMPKYDPSKAVSFVKMSLKYSGGGKLAKWLPVATRNKELITTLQNEMEVERFTKEPRLDTKAKKKNFKTRNAETWTNITEEQMTALNKAQNTPFKVNMEAVGDLISMWGENTGELTAQQIKVAQLFGYDTVEDKHIDRRGGVTAKNNDIVESIQALVDFSKVANGRKVYFDYFFSKNGRFFMDSNTVNPQTDKLHRFLVTVDGGNTTIDNSSRDVYKIAIVQAFDQEKDLSSMDEDGTELRDIGAVDKQKQEATIAQFDGIVNNVKIQEAIDAIKNSADNVPDKVLTAISNTKHPGHALAALRALVNYNENENFEADITMETDGTTSGFLLGLLTNPVMPFHKLVEWLAKGGVWVGSKTAETYGEYKSIAGNKDGYETSASAIDIAVKRHSVTRPGILDFVGGVNRSFMKNPLMIFVYGAGIRRIRREIGQQAADKMIDSLSAGKSFDSMKLIIEDEIGILRENRTEEGLEKQDILNIDKKIRELVGLRKELDGNVERLASKIREESVDANGMVTKLHKVVSSAAEKTYGAEVGNYLEDTFSELVSMRKAMNDVFDVSYKVFIDEFNRRSKEELTPGKTKLSKKQLEVLLGDMVDEGKIPGILTVEATHRDEKAPIMKERKQPGLGDESKVQIGYAKDGKISTRTVHPMIYKMLANSTAGSVINIHYLDGAIIGKIIADGQGFGIHDAFVAHVNDVIGSVKKYNENVWTMTQEYNMLQRTLNELKRVHKANPQIVEEYYRLKSVGEIVVTYADGVHDLQTMVSTINENKRLLSSMRVVSAQMAGPIGSTFDKPGLEDVVAKADNVGNVAAAVGLVRGTEGMSKENSDIVTASIKTDCKVNK